MAALASSCSRYKMAAADVRGHLEITKFPCVTVVESNWKRPFAVPMRVCPSAMDLKLLRVLPVSEEKLMDITLSQDRPQRWDVVKIQMEEFCNSSTIHGLRYIGEVKRPWLERFMWVTAFILSLTACLYLILSAWAKWEESPVIMTVDSKLRRVMDIPFPGVTICPETKFKKSLSEKLRRGNLTEDEQQLFDDRSLVCHFYERDGNSDLASNATIDNLENAAPDINETLSFFSDIFKPVMTDEGLCFSFNTLRGQELFANDTFHASRKYLDFEKASQWTPDDGYLPSAKEKAYPQRVLAVGPDQGFFIDVFQKEEDIDDSCIRGSKGFKVLLHSPADFPQVSQLHYYVPLERVFVISVAPSMMTTSPGLRGLAPHKRQCYFSTERKLRFFNVYTKQNCLAECLTNFTINKCGCVAHYMPRLMDTPVCGSKRINCAVYSIQSQMVEQLKKGVLNKDNASRCDCLQSCEELEFNSEIVQNTMQGSKNGDYRPGYMRTRLVIFFKKEQFLAIRRSELYGPTDFFANCGGLLGLGMGFSILSFIEIVYWLALRIWCPTRVLRGSMS